MDSTLRFDLPAHLGSHQAMGLVPGQSIAQFEIGELRNFVYLILDWDSRQAALVDPQKDLSEPLNALEKHGFMLSTVLLTHTHFDHTAGLPELARNYPGIPIRVHGDDVHRLHRLENKSPVVLMSEGDCFSLGKVNIRTLHTPGHSSGEICWFLTTDRPYLLTGDTIFIRDCGRTDLPTGSDDEMFASIQSLKTLPPETILLPGHHYAAECATTLGRELRESPPFLCKSVEELMNLP